MRTIAVLRSIVLAAFTTTPALLQCQFQQPTDEELKMTSDPLAPGAAAVYLYREEETDDRNHFYSFYSRIKVLTEKGKELATIHVPYEHGVDTVTDIQGRTIHSDGSIVPLSAKPADLMEFKGKGFQVNTVVFTLPSVEVGSILEYRLKIRSPDYRVSQPVWDIQSPYFAHKAHYSFLSYLAPGRYIRDANGETLNRLMFASRLAPGAQVIRDDAKGLYSLDLTDIPAIPEDDWMPPINSLRWHVEFYFGNSNSAADFWRDAGKRWAIRTDDFTKPTNALKNAAEGLFAPADTDEQKARKVYAAVQKLDNTDFTRKKSEAEEKREKIKEIRNADDVWKQQSGSANDIALLYIALARTAGLKVFPAQVVNRNRAIFDTRYLSTKQLDDYLAILVLDGKEVYLDPGQKMCPFAGLHWKHTLASGFRATDKDPAPVTSPAASYKAAEVQRVAQLSIDPAGALTGSVRIVMSGPDALHWRQLSLENDSDEMKKKFNESIQGDFPDGVQADFDHFLALDDPTVNLIAIVKVTGSLGTVTGKHVFLPALFFDSKAKQPFVAQEKRTTPVDVHYPKQQQDDVTYHLPPGFTLDSALPPTSAVWPDHAVIKIASQFSGDSVEVSRTLAYNFTLLQPSDYGNLHDFYQKVATADQQQLVLTRGPVAHGN